MGILAAKRSFIFKYIAAKRRYMFVNCLAARREFGETIRSPLSFLRSEGRSCCGLQSQMSERACRPRPPIAFCLAIAMELRGCAGVDKPPRADFTAIGNAAFRSPALEPDDRQAQHIVGWVLNDRSFSGSNWSEWQDLNLRPLRPERSALPG